MFKKLVLLSSIALMAGLVYAEVTTMTGHQLLINTGKRTFNKTDAVLVDSDLLDDDNAIYLTLTLQTATVEISAVEYQIVTNVVATVSSTAISVSPTVVVE